MPQPSLFTDDFPNPMAHAGDPLTSHQAAADHTASGRRAKHAAIVLALAWCYPGLTATELWHEANETEQAELKEMQEVRRRLTDLLHAGSVRQGPSRRCTVKGTLMVTWFASREGADGGR